MFFKFWLRRKFRFFLTLLGFAVGVMLFFTLTAVKEHFQMLSDHLKSSLFNKIFVCEKPTFWAGVGVLPEEKLQEIKNLPGVKKVIPLLIERLRREQLFALGTPEMVTGIPLSELPELWGKLRLQAGSFPAKAGNFEALVGDELAIRTQLKPGDKITLGEKEFTIRGILAPPAYLLSRQVIVELNDLSDALYRKGLYTAFAIIPEGNLSFNELAQKLRQIPGFLVYPPERLREETRRTFLLWNTLILVTAVLSLLGGGVLLGVSLLLTLRERIFEIGLKKAMGAKDSRLFLEFLAEGFLLALLGFLLGSLGGFSLIGFLDHSLKAAGFSIFTLTPKVWLLSCFLSFLTGILIPGFFALWSLKFSPAEAMKK